MAFNKSNLLVAYVVTDTSFFLKKGVNSPFFVVLSSLYLFTHVLNGRIGAGLGVTSTTEAVIYTTGNLNFPKV